jgi:biotin transporter BioY
LKVCFILMPFILVSLLISRAVDMHQETNQTMLQTLYEANANLGGLIIIFALGIFLFFGLLFIRRQWPGQKLP